MSRRQAALALLATVLLAGGACSQGPPRVSETELVLGVDAPLTGPQGAQGTVMVDAVKSVVAGEWKARIEDLPVRVAVFDDTANLRRDPAKGEQNLRLMIGNPRLVGVIGPLNSDVAAAEIPVATGAHLALISPSATNPCLTRPAMACGGLASEVRTGAGSGFFRVVASDDGQGAALVDYARAALRLGRIAVGSDSQPSGKSFADGIEAAARRHGIAIALRQDIDPTSDQQADGFLGLAKTGGAEAIFFGGDQDGGVCRVRARMKTVFEPSTPFLGAGGIHGAMCLRDAGTMAGGMFAADAGSGDLETASRVAARVLLRAIGAAVKRSGGNAPSREEVRLAVSRSTMPAFDARGDLREQVFTIYRSDAAPAWIPVGPVTVAERS